MVTRAAPRQWTHSLEVTVAGDVPAEEADLAEAVIGRLLERHRLSGPVIVRLTGSRELLGSMLVQVNLSVGERPVRAQVEGPYGSALIRAVERLDWKIHWLSGEPASRRRQEPERLPPIRPGTHARIVRRKHYTLRTCHPADAIATMDAMDYAAHLFIDSETGDDAVAYRAEPFGVRIVRKHHGLIAPAARDFHSSMDRRLARVHSEADAVALLDDRRLPFVFFTDADHDRGRLLYRRYDGGLALVLPG